MQIIQKHSFRILCFIVLSSFVYIIVWRLYYLNRELCFSHESGFYDASFNL